VGLDQRFSPALEAESNHRTVRSPVAAASASLILAARSSFVSSWRTTPSRCAALLHCSRGNDYIRVGCGVGCPISVGHRGGHLSPPAQVWLPAESKTQQGPRISPPSQSHTADHRIQPRTP
jgi:hypothetical protein